MRSGRRTDLIVSANISKLSSIPRDNGRRLIIENYISALEAGDLIDKSMIKVPHKINHSERYKDRIDIYIFLEDFLNDLERKGYGEYKIFFKDKMETLGKIYGSEKSSDFEDAKYEVIDF